MIVYLIKNFPTPVLSVSGSAPVCARVSSQPEKSGTPIYGSNVSNKNQRTLTKYIFQKLLYAF